MHKSGARSHPTLLCGRRTWRNREGEKAEEVAMSEQASKIEHEAIPQWAEGLYYNKGLFSEVLVYHDDEALYF
jgi:hypothetical protein